MGRSKKIVQSEASAPTEGARRATEVGAEGAADGAGPLTPGQRWSAGRKRDDLVKKFFPESDRALPQRGRVRPRRVPPQFGAVCDEGMHQDLMFVG